MSWEPAPFSETTTIRDRYYVRLCIVRDRAEGDRIVAACYRPADAERIAGLLNGK